MGSGLSNWELRGFYVDCRIIFYIMDDLDMFFSGILSLHSCLSFLFFGRRVLRTISSTRPLRHHLQVRLFYTSLIVDYTRCHWDVQVIAPAAFNVVADLVLFLYPFPIIFMANIPKSLRYSLLFVFALCGLVTASAIVRVIYMTAGRLLQEGNIYK